MKYYLIFYLEIVLFVIELLTVKNYHVLKLVQIIVIIKYNFDKIKVFFYIYYIGNKFNIYFHAFILSNKYILTYTICYKL